MGKLNRAVVLSVVFSLSISLLFSSCKVEQNEIQSEETTETEFSETSSYSTEQSDNSSGSNNNEINYPYDLSVKVIGSSQSGDCTLLRYNTTEILIDTSYGKESINAVNEILEEKKDDTDHIWDYVIFTHPDADHVKYATDFFKLLDSKGWEVGHLIDFGDEREEDQESQDEADLLTAYKKARNELINNSNVEYYSPNSLDILESRKNQEYTIDPYFRLTILYNEAYTKAYKNKHEDNELSVCCLFQVGNQKLLFTGDLEQDGEKALLNNHRELLRNVTFFKAGHHGSHTSNTLEFVDWIRPAYVAITYNYKITEDALANNISKFLKYTDYIYPTAVKDNTQGAYSLFGNCLFDFNGKNVNVTSELNDNCTIKQAIINETMTNWYWKHVSNSMISDEINTYFFDENDIVYSDGSQELKPKPGNFSYYNCTLVKYGHYDILIDCGSNHTDSKAFVEKLKDYVVDGTIEYVVVSHYQLPNYSQLIGSSIYDEGVFKQFRIENIIDNDSSMTNCYNTAGTTYSVYLGKVLTISNRISIKEDDFIELPVCDGVKLSVYRGNKGRQHENEDDYSLVTMVDFYNKQMVFVGDLTNYTWFNDTYAQKLKNVYLVRFPSSYVEYNKMTGLDEFLKITHPDVIVIGSPVNHWNNGQFFIKGSSVSGLVTFLENSSRNRNIQIYSPGYIENNINQSVYGDLDFSLFSRARKIGDYQYSYYVSCHKYLGNGKTIDREVHENLNTSYFNFVPDDLRCFPI